MPFQRLMNLNRFRSIILIRYQTAKNHEITIYIGENQRRIYVTLLFFNFLLHKDRWKKAIFHTQSFYVMSYLLHYSIVCKLKNKFNWLAILIADQLLLKSMV